MANAQGFAKVTLNGEEKILKYDMNAMCELEETFDLGISEILDSKRMGIRTIRALYRAGLIWKEPKITLTAVGKMLTEKMEEEEISFKELMEPVMKGITAARWIKAKKADETSEADEKN